MPAPRTSASIVEMVAVNVLVNRALPKALPVKTCAKFSNVGVKKMFGVAEKA